MYSISGSTTSQARHLTLSSSSARAFRALWKRAYHKYADLMAAVPKAEKPKAATATPKPAAKATLKPKVTAKAVPKPAATPRAKPVAKGNATRKTPKK